MELLDALPSMDPLPLSHLESYKPAKVIDLDSSNTVPGSCSSNTRSTSIHIDDSGQYLVAACTDDSLKLFDCTSANFVRSVFSKKYGAHLARFTHTPHHVLYASTKPVPFSSPAQRHSYATNAHAIRYLSTTDNRYVRYFKGHTEQINSLEMSPLDDVFVSSSIDGTVRTWDTRTPNCHGCIDFGRNPLIRAVVGIDPSSRVLAVATNSTPSDLAYIRLYDLRKLEKGPFQAQPIHDPETEYPPVPSVSPSQPTPNLTGVKFSNNGTLVLITTSEGVHFVIDSFLPHKTVARVGTPSYSNAGDAEYPAKSSEFNRTLGCEADFSPDSIHVIVANPDQAGSLMVYNALNGDLNCYLDYPSAVPLEMVLSNPRYKMIVTCEKNNLGFWIPS